MDLSFAAAGLPATTERAQRHDGWTPDRQRAFLESIAEGYSVEQACRLVGMAPSSAYALRRRAAGAGFALGWRAANLLAREKVADTLLARAIDGQVDTYTRADGATVTRHRYDNRLASTMLARLDRFADAEAREATHHAARLVAAEFDSFLDLVERGEGPARAGLFLGTRLVGEEGDPDLDAIVSLARADRWLRTGRGAAQEIDTRDLDPDARATWTAEQWARADAAGMLAFAAPDETTPHSPLSPLHPDETLESDEDEPVWWDEYTRQWRTSLAPADGFVGDQNGDYGDEDYSRALTAEEEDLVIAVRRAEHDAVHAAGVAERDAWFAALAAEPAIDPTPPAEPAAKPIFSADLSPEPASPNAPAAELVSPVLECPAPHADSP